MNSFLLSTPFNFFSIFPLFLPLLSLSTSPSLMQQHGHEPIGVNLCPFFLSLFLSFLFRSPTTPLLPGLQFLYYCFCRSYWRFDWRMCYCIHFLLRLYAIFHFINNIVYFLFSNDQLNNKYNSKNPQSLRRSYHDIWWRYLWKESLCTQSLPVFRTSQRMWIGFQGWKGKYTRILDREYLIRSSTE